MKEIRGCECGVTTLEPPNPMCQTPDEHMTEAERDALSDADAVKVAREVAPLLYQRIMSGSIPTTPGDIAAAESNEIRRLPQELQRLIGGDKLHKTNKHRR